jgi:6-pyruvoyltetrahydropterin/6-carboxytetrahydropterin synthase
MLITLYTEEFFHAAHHLENYEGKCARLHGHTWKVSVWVKGDEERKNQTGLLWDFGNVRKIIDTLDHQLLNEVLPNNPTVENITRYIYDKLKEDAAELQFKVRVYENITTRQSYCELGDF